MTIKIGNHSFENVYAFLWRVVFDDEVFDSEHVSFILDLCAYPMGPSVNRVQRIKSVTETKNLDEVSNITGRLVVAFRHYCDFLELPDVEVLDEN